MIRWGGAAVASLLLMSSAGAQTVDYSGAYFCAEEYSGGVAYDELTKRWGSTTFRADTKFVLSLAKSGESAFNYTVTVAHLGEDRSLCFPPGLSILDSVLIYTDDFRCEVAPYFIYRFNLSTKRFLSMYVHGFVDGDRPGNTPAMNAGTCAKIE